MGNWIQEGDVPRVMVPVDIYPRLTLGVPAARAYGALAMRADNATGLVDSTVEQIAEAADMSRRQAAEGVKVLRTAGYLQQLSQGRSGRSSRYRIYSEPQDAEIRTLEDQGAETRTLQGAEIRTLGESACGFPHISVRISAPPLVSSLVSTKNTLASGEAEEVEQGSGGGVIPGLLVEAPRPKTAKAKAPAKSDYPDDFEAFWSAYPVRVSGKARTRGDKRKAAALFRKLTDSGELTVDQLMALARVYSEDMAGGDKAAYVMDATRFLGGRWEDWRQAAKDVEGLAAGELSDAEVDQILGKDLRPLPALPPGMHPGSPEAREQRARDITERKAERQAQALARKQGTTVPRQGNVRSIA